MISPAILLGWSAIAAIAAIAPGPDVLLVTGHAARGGRDAGLRAAAGTTMGGLWYMALCGFGFLSVLTASPALFMAVKVGGAFYLAYLGINMLRGAVRPAKVTQAEALVLSRPFRQGLLTNVLNPKIAVFYLAALPQFVGRGPDAPFVGMALIAIHYAIGAAWLFGLALIASRARGVAQNSKVWRWIEGALGTAFIGLAGKLALERN